MAVVRRLLVETEMVVVAEYRRLQTNRPLVGVVEEHRRRKPRQGHMITQRLLMRLVLGKMICMAAMV